MAGIVAVTAVTPQALVAQGSAQAEGGTAGRAALERPHVEPARGILRTLVGTWRFEIWFAGNFDGPPDAAGTRVMSRLYDDLGVQWTEEVDHSSVRGQGIIGFDARTGRFFSTSVHNVGSGAEFMTGILERGEPLVTFTTIEPGARPGQRPEESSILSVLDPNHFSWAPRDRAWRALFTREE